MSTGMENDNDDVEDLERKMVGLTVHHPEHPGGKGDHHPEPEGKDKWLDPDMVGWVYGEGLSANGEDFTHNHALAYRRVTVLALNTLQEMFKEAAKTERESEMHEFSYLCPLDSPEKMELWTATNGKADLKGAVFSVRGVLEKLLHYEKHPDKHGPNLLLGPDRESRWQRICGHAWKLMRSSKKGPDVPVQWSGHIPDNHHAYTVVNKTTMLELVERLAVIMEEMLVGRDAGEKGKAIAVHKALIAAFDSVAILEHAQRLNKDGSPGKKQHCDNPEVVFNEHLKDGK